MTARDKWRQVQAVLGNSQDGWPGKNDDAALQKLKQDALTEAKTVILRGDGTWPWVAQIDGDDILIKNAVVTAFGGANDSMDSGETASGISTRDNPDFIGCALPMRRDTSVSLRGSPIPKLPWKTEVQFIDGTGGTVTTELIDEGPAKWTGHAGDLTVAAARYFDPAASANNFTKRLDIRILGGAKYAT